MQLIALIASLLVAASGVSSRGYDAWSLFKAGHGKVYESHQVESLRREIFNQNKAKIDQFNQQEAESRGFRLGINHLADWTEAELQKLHGARVPAELLAESSSPGEQQFLDKILADQSIEVPDELDWRKIPGRVSEVKDQGYCGSCWAFSSTGALEGQELVRNISLAQSKSLVELSEQNLVDCVPHQGCYGGWMSVAFSYVRDNDGIDDELSYPYEGVDGKCRYKKNKRAFSDSGWNILPEGDEQTLKKVVAKFGPVSVAIDSMNSEFQSYESGVFNSDTCGNKMDDMNHAVLVVGYGTDPKAGDYWIVKNSWSSSWGEKGYIRMARNKANQCGIVTAATIPTFSS